MLIRDDVDNTPRCRPGERLHHLFEAKCDAVPADQRALEADDATYTFRALDARANQAARRLLALGIKAGDRVAALFDKSSHGYVGLLALLKIGAAYVPLDARFPEERVAFILADAGATAILSVSAFEEKLAPLGRKTVYLDTETAALDALPTTRLGDDEAPAPEDDLFYVIYTSGTTGKPKGVAIDHAGIVNFVRVAGEEYGMTDGDRCYQGMTLAFDFHVESLWGPLIAGATLVAPPEGACLFGADLHAYLTERRVTILPCVPTLWATLEADLPDVRIIILSGEAVPHHLVKRWHRDDRLILNAYGPTECSVSSTLRRLTPENQVTVGKPLPTYTVVILDPEKPETVADGAQGEIGIAGVALARGYLNRPELTAEKFIPDFLDLPNNPSRRIYRTGDLGRVRADGELEFHGRIDTQVKIRGYRVELGEIEAVLQACAGEHQAIVNPVEMEPGAPELAAFFVRKSDGPAPSTEEMVAALKDKLPSYMRPSYLEELDAIPMTSNTKADRKNLPKPQGPRVAISSGQAVAPRNALERAIAEELGRALNVENPSVTDDFFRDLGAHSLLMARFGAALRQRLGVAMSMRDVYLNPTVEALAKRVEAAQGDEVVAGPKTSETFHVASKRDYLLCGALQGAWILGWSAFGVWLTVESVLWTYAAMPDLLETYLRLLAVGVGLAVAFTALPIAAKWLVIGRWREEEIPLWSLRYFRFWAMKRLVRSAPMAGFGDPFLNAYLRLLGAKIGANTVIHAKTLPVCTDLLSVGSDTIIRKETLMNTYKAEGGRIVTGAVALGDDVFVGEGAVLDVNVAMGDGAQLGHASSLQAGQRVEAGKRAHGAPAVETTADYRQIAPEPCSAARRWIYAATLVASGFLLAPIPAILVYALFPGATALFGVTAVQAAPSASAVLALFGTLALASLPVYLAGLAAAFVFLRATPWLLNRFIAADKVYPLYGPHYYAHSAITRLSNSEFFNAMFGDATFTPTFMKWVGWKVNKIVQSGSNFGSDQRHDNPFLCDIGSGVMVSGGLKMINETVSSSSFKVSRVAVGENSYLGNYVRIPSDAKIGRNVLVGTKALVPIDGPVREDVGLLGAPAFEIPRAANRDLELAKMDPEEAATQLARKARYNAVTTLLFTLNWWIVSVIGASAALGGYLAYPSLGAAGFMLASSLGLGVLVAWMWFVERASLGFGRLKPQLVRVLDDYYWFHERHKAVSLLHVLEGATAGTPFKNWVSRLQGVTVGAQVFDDGFQFNEYTLISIGDHCSLNAGGLIQPHTLEEAVFKSDYVTVGDCVTLGSACNLHYGVTAEDYVTVDPNSFVMKGEILDADTTWRGNPAQAVVSRAAPKPASLAEAAPTRRAARPARAAA